MNSNAPSRITPHTAGTAVDTASPELPWAAKESDPIAVRIAAKTATRIVEGEHPPGTILTEKGIAEAEGASRTPVREAMLQLQRWGLVQLAPKKGAVVTAPTPDKKRELLQVRAMFEKSAFAEVVKADGSRRQLLLDNLRSELARQHAAAEAGDPLSFAEADYRFHAHVIEAMRNQVVDDICRNLAPQLARMTYAVAAEHPELIRTLLHDHETLVTHLEDGEPENFATLLQDHIATGHGTDLS